MARISKVISTYTITVNIKTYMITTFEIITINLVAIYYHGNMRGRREIIHPVKTARYCPTSIVIIKGRCACLNI